MSHKCLVFGSNRTGWHNAGAAYFARKYRGAIYGQAEGLQGNSYAIPTKELRRTHDAVMLPEVAQGVERFLNFAREHPELEFEVTAIGCGLAGFYAEQIAPLFRDSPSNVELPEVFKKILEK